MYFMLRTVQFNFLKTKTNSSYFIATAAVYITADSVVEN